MYTTIDSMMNQVFVSVENKDNTELIFTRADGKQFVFFHYQDCCENVYIEDIIGDLNDLVGSPILQAEEATESDDSNYITAQWTFYKFATIKGYVTVRWYGYADFYSLEVSYGWR